MSNLTYNISSLGSSPSRMYGRYKTFAQVLAVGYKPVSWVYCLNWTVGFIAKPFSGSLIAPVAKDIIRFKVTYSFYKEKQLYEL